MKYVILAAGIGSRLAPQVNDRPKILLDLGGGYTLLDQHIQNALSQKAFDEVVIVAGYKFDQVNNFVEKNKNKHKIDVSVLFNKDYANTSPLRSLDLAARYVNGCDIAVVNGDLYYHSGILKKLDYHKEGYNLFISRGCSGIDAMNVSLSNNHVASVSKGNPARKDCSESIGVFIVKGKRFFTLFARSLNKLLENPKAGYWHNIVDYLAKKEFVSYTDVGNFFWKEVDTCDDLMFLREHIYSHAKK